VGHTPADDGREVFAAVLPDILHGGDFVVRHARDDDVPSIIALVDDEVRRRLLLPDVVDEPTTRLMVLHGGALIIAGAHTDRPLGGIRLFLHGDAVEFGYWLGADARGRGLATRALLLVSAEIVARLGPSRLELRTTIGNEPSERVAVRAGFERVGPEPPIEYPGGRIVETTLWILEPKPVSFV
jgi:RimJ/RimL family protein N-acetyltransferase